MAWRKRTSARACTTSNREPPPLEQRGLEMVHELRNSLTAMKALVQLGLRNPAEFASHARLAIIEEEITRMQEVLLRCVAVGRPIDDRDAAGAAA